MGFYGQPVLRQGQTFAHARPGQGYHANIIRERRGRVPCHYGQRRGRGNGRRSRRVARRGKEAWERSTHSALGKNTHLQRGLERWRETLYDAAYRQSHEVESYLRL